eukprot:SAG11_NODE_4480_length_1880_cov_0.888827_2_plen_77_part_00
MGSSSTPSPANATASGSPAAPAGAVQTDHRIPVTRAQNRVPSTLRLYGQRVLQLHPDVKELLWDGAHSIPYGDADS